MGLFAKLIVILSSVSSFTLITETACILVTIFLIQRAFLSSLARIPGPLICRFTNVWMWYHTYIGDDCTLVKKLHDKYGPVVRIGPNDCAIADGAALAPVYVERGGFLKAQCYRNFDLEGFETVFSTTNPNHRAPRSKAITSLFSTSSIRSKHSVFEDCAKRFVDRINRDIRPGKPLDILMLCRRVSLEAVCSVLFDTPYGSLEEGGDSLSAAAFVDGAASVSRFFFLPHWLYKIVEPICAKWLESQAAADSTVHVDDYGHTLRADQGKKPGTYQARLKQAGVSDAEVESQCKDVIFAGTDSNGTVLAATCWHLVRHPDIYEKLKSEIAEADAQDPSHNVQTLRYLDAVTREGLRLARANPTRFPRVVPQTGWAFNATNGKTYYFPPGTIVGCAPLTLHSNAAVFHDPTAFKPERWLDGATPEMHRDLIPFSVGPRQCIARNMAQYELLVIIRELARSKILDKAKTVKEEIPMLEWFNGRFVDQKVEMVW